MSLCHPERKHFCKDLCKNCYNNKKPSSKLARQRYEKSEKGKAGRKLSRAISDPGGLRMSRRGRKSYELHRAELLKPENVRRRNLARRGVTPESYQIKLQEQKGCCAICGTDNPGGYRGKDGTRGAFAADHDHACCNGVSGCGECNRGLLCMHCNQALGKFQDSPKILKAAIEYLRQYGKPSSDLRK